MEILSKAIPVTMLAFVLSSMLSMGLSLTVGQILLPLRNHKIIVLALLARARLSRLAAIAQPSLGRLSILSLALLIALLLITNMQNVVSLYGTRGVLASVLFIAAGAGIGWVLGGPQSDTRGVMALGTAQRNIAAALVVGGQNFKD